MESLQLAQMLADLSSLNATDQNAAHALVTADKAIERAERDQQSHPTPPRPSDDLRRAASAQNHHNPNKSSTSPSSACPSPAPPGSAPAKFDKFGRRILTSPPLTRTNSAQNSPLPGTPRLLARQGSGYGSAGGPEHHEDDLDRASTLMALYDIRAKLKQQDNSSLMKAREKVADLATKQQQQQQQQQPSSQGQMQSPGKNDGAKYSYPK